MNPPLVTDSERGHAEPAPRPMVLAALPPGTRPVRIEDLHRAFGFVAAARTTLKAGGLTDADWWLDLAWACLSRVSEGESTDAVALVKAVKDAAGFLSAQGSPAAQRMGDELTRALKGMA